MRISITQLRRIIKEEVEQVFLTEEFLTETVSTEKEANELFQQLLSSDADEDKNFDANLKSLVDFLEKKKFQKVLNAPKAPPRPAPRKRDFDKEAEEFTKATGIKPLNPKTFGK